ncbi:hypothetical protein CMI37_31460 [Candidatus Pacearchaeota archaeon]|nr:hypothetical protein [Candidatus Pacearchaeota archaeon]|tara:strand:+ start:635 stop:853 length:219 start_codon:yes stop_codon:yes gene_type:complete
MSYIKSFLGDLRKSAASKRVLGATLTAFFLAMAEEWGVNSETAMSVAGIAIALIVGDSLRPVNPEKTNGSSS